MNLLNLQMGSDTSSFMVLKEGSGTFSTISDYNVSATVTIPHGYSSDLLLAQVVLKDGSTGQVYVTPMIGGARYNLRSELDSTNLYIKVVLTSSGDPFPAITWDYQYRILVP